jgi:hypothetical protein
MILKELVIATVSYNPLIQVGRISAERAKVPPRNPSFAGVWSSVTIVLQSPSKWRERPKRSYPRTVIARGRKYSERRPRAKPAEP